MAQCRGETVLAVARATGLSSTVAGLLVNRGMDNPAKAAAFLSPGAAQFHDPLLMRDMPEALDKLFGALAGGKSIVIYGDYDVDGITSTAMLVEFLRTLTPAVRYFIPERLQDGYGIKIENLSALRKLGADLVITVDCGVSNNAEIQTGRQLGLDFIITDHHPSACIPQGVPVIDPQRPDCPYPNKDLAGAGVVFKLIQGAKAIMEGRTGEIAVRVRAFDLGRAVEMAAIGTIGDVVSLTGENRVLASLGLEKLRRTRRPGLAALKEISGIDDKLDSSAVAYYLAPRLNASGRLGRADRGVQLFLEEDPARAREIALELNEENRLRQKLEIEIFEEAKRRLGNDENLSPTSAIILADDNWHPGVIGIVASRLVDLYHCPAVLLAGAGEHLKGSIRSIPECPLPAILEGCAEYLASWGGHRMAAGFQLHRDNLRAFRRRFTDLASENAGTAGITPRLAIDMEMDFCDLKVALLEEISRMEPFGCANPPPLFLTQKVVIAREPEVFGERHLRLHLRSSSREMKALGFRMGHFTHDLCKKHRKLTTDIVFTPEVSRSGSRREIVLNLKDIRLDYRIENAPGEQG